MPRPHRDLKDIDSLLAATGDFESFKKALPGSISVEDGITALLRSCFKAAPGKRLVIADYAAIEARGVAWCADETKLLNKFRRGEDVYCALASQILGHTVTKQQESERAIGKEAVLGCGYGMGSLKFGARVAAQGIDLAAANTSAEAVVEGYRDAYPAIAGTKVNRNGMSWRQGGLWKDVEKAARDALTLRTPHEAGHCLFYPEGTSLILQLPSGRRITYRNARIEEAAEADPFGRKQSTIVFDGPGRHSSNETTYGGKLVENIVQAVCRDLMSSAVLECERQGLPVVLHVHDEIVLELPEAEAEKGLRQLVTIMSSPPNWAADFPVQVEGYVVDRYRKSPAKGAARMAARDGRIIE